MITDISYICLHAVLCSLFFFLNDVKHKQVETILLTNILVLKHLFFLDLFDGYINKQIFSPQTYFH